MIQRIPKTLMMLILSFTLAAPLWAAEETDKTTKPVEDATEAPVQENEVKEQESQNTKENKNDEVEKSQDAATSASPAAQETQTTDTEAAQTDVVTDDTQQENTIAEPQEEAAPAAQQAVAKELDEPTIAESRTIAWVFAGLTVASAAGGVYAGLQAQEQFNCLSDVIACNDGRDAPIENEDFLKAKSDLDRITLLADMGFLTAVVTSTVTIAAIVKALSTEAPTEQDQRTSMLSPAQE